MGSQYGLKFGITGVFAIDSKRRMISTNPAPDLRLERSKSGSVKIHELQQIQDVF